ncbi:hypothetical protein F4824DRAFT_517910 [Ustulina deusta]|nr:hypothetical protein F4824DRAFT_517910 [Ustulina deusta]
MAGAENPKPSCGLLLFPVELKIAVLSFTLLNSSRDLLNLAMSCKTMHETFKENQPHIIRAFLSQLEPKELAIATAHYHATIAPWKYVKDLDVPVPQDRQDRQDYLHKITNFCEQYLSKQGTELRVPVREFTLPMVAHICEIHSAIRAIAAKLAPKIVACNTSRPDPTPIEIAKISKCLYIIDLVGLLFPKSPVSELQHARGDVSQHDHAFTKFWSCFAP